MPWEPFFLDALRGRRLSPQYRLEVAPVPGFLPGLGLHLHSHSRGYGHPAVLSLQGASVQAGLLNVADWSHSVGSLSIGIRSTVDVRKTIPRGILVQLMMGLAGWDEEDYQPIFRGQVQDIRWTGQQWQLSARSLLGAISTRFGSEPSLFHELTSTTLASGYSPTDTELELVDKTGLAALTEVGSYLVLVTPDAGSPFFLTATGLSGETLEGVSATGQFGTTAGAATAGNTVQICAYLPQDPVEAALTVLTSIDGTGGNGPYDLGPDSWGVGLPFGYVDLDDAILTRNAIRPGSGDPWWDIYSTGPQPNALSWLQGILQPAGIWLAERQGCITVRSVQDVGELTYGFSPIFDRDIVSITASAWAPEQPAEYRQLDVVGPTGTATELADPLDSRPGVALKTNTLPYAFTNEANWVAKVHSRLFDWHTKVGESFEIELVGWRYAHLCPGDLILLGSRYLRTRYDQESVALVTSVQPNWFGASTRIRALHLRDVSQFSG